MNQVYLEDKGNYLEDVTPARFSGHESILQQQAVSSLIMMNETWKGMPSDGSKVTQLWVDKKRFFESLMARAVPGMRFFLPETVNFGINGNSAL